MKISVIGCGAWGTTLAKVFCENSHDTLLWCHAPEISDSINSSRENTALLPGIVLPNSLVATHDFSHAVERAEVLVLVVASQFFENVAQKIAGGFKGASYIISATKGLTESTHRRMSEVLFDILPPQQHARVAVLSGPNISGEIARGFPSTTVLSSSDPEMAQTLQQLLGNSYLRVYTNSDIAGTEWGGTLKNIIAIAAGIVDGLGLGNNAKSALMVRGLVEMSRFAVHFGARAETLMGLAGLGDLITTCSSTMSRNHFVGENLGKGKKLSKILASMTAVSEGVSTTRLVWELARKNNLEMPVTEQIYQILFADKPVDSAIRELMSRQVKSEISG